MSDNVPPNKPPDEEPKSESTDAPESQTGGTESEPTTPEAPPAESSGAGAGGEAPPPPASPPPPATEPPPAASPPPAAPAPQSDNRTLMLVLAYLFILGLIPLLTEKDDAEVQWHAKNGLVWTATWFIFWVVMFILGFIPVVNVIVGVVGCLLLPVVAIGAIVIHVMGIVKALNGERFRLPVLSDYADRWQ